MPTAKTQTETQGQAASEMLGHLQTKALDAFTAFAETNQRVLQGVVDLSVATAREGLRTFSELQTATVEAARAPHAATPSFAPPSIEEIQSDPFAWYQKSLLTTIDGTQKTFRLFEANAQVVTRTAERLQASAERTSKEIQEALTSYVSRIKDIYARN